jgi:tetratricopeptide (TPR) repeat protein
MMKSLSIIVFCIALQGAAFSQATNTAEEARSLGEQATERAREGNLREALRLYRVAVTDAPDDLVVLQNYAVVLGWAEEYANAISVINKIMSLESDQPDWALREFARSFLFGNATDKALDCLDKLVQRGDYTEQTLSRRALALRWLNRTDEAQVAYADMLQRYPESAAAYSGLAYTQAGQGRMSEALRTLEASPSAIHQAPDVIRTRIQILNWMGRHYEAQRLIASVPPEMAESREILQERIAAARWGGNPAGAMHDIMRLVSLYPDQGTRSLLGQLKTEYGHSLMPSFRFSKDSDGLVDQATSLETSFHINPAHAVRVGYQYRWLEQASRDLRTLVRYDLGWSGSFTRRLSLYTNVSNIDYRRPGLRQKLFGDGSFSFAASDALKFGGGGGTIPMDAFQAIDKQVTASFGFAEFALNVGRNRVQSRYSQFAFSNDVNRNRFDAEFMRPVATESALNLSLGLRSSFMSHNEWTPDFYSPSRLQTYFAVLRPSGSITRWMDYAGELAGGWQAEPNSSWLHPFQASGRLVWHPSRHWRGVIEASKSTASVDRLGPGIRAYSRWTASAGIEVHLP